MGTTRRPQLSVTPIGLAYISGDYHDRLSAHHAEAALRTIWANRGSAGLTAALHAERSIHQARAEQMADAIVRDQT